ncbi:hypothetical protein E2562_015179 [Oryza meyeriana var. granulata]|uniref:Uncharacterized protein n=1 Tax=Oryza meyeriana var. granulata TaxID=110450 RepID=A0A6G1EWQ0_9ORYZ|nr:hypothetical protein E2562_015179 [Oryza meyeriana var. granulata]
MKGAGSWALSSVVALGSGITGEEDLEKGAQWRERDLGAIGGQSASHGGSLTSCISASQLRGRPQQRETGSPARRR